MMKWTGDEACGDEVGGWPPFFQSSKVLNEMGIDLPTDCPFGD